MSLKILHTADWHLGQKFYDYDRMDEHRHFLQWLVQTIHEECVDVLLIAGDIFDVANPSSEAQRLYYSFLHELIVACPGVQVVLIAGNHDSASRLEAPSALLKAFNITVVGNVERVDSVTSDNQEDSVDPSEATSQMAEGCMDSSEVASQMQEDTSLTTEENSQNEAEDRNFDKWNLESLIIPLHNRLNQIEAYCLAVPYLRPGDYPIYKSDENPYSAGVNRLYRALTMLANEQMNGQYPLVAMGHLHTLDAALSDSERGIRGGLEMVDAATFHDSLIYTALGHIHKAQCIGGDDSIRYAGSPIPMSFSETNYKHHVVIVTLDHHHIICIEEKVIPRLVDFKRIGSYAHPLGKEEVMKEIEAIPTIDTATSLAPYLEINIQLEGPDLLINQQIKEALADKQIRLARIQAYYPQTIGDDEMEVSGIEEFKEITPAEMFIRYYQRKYHSEVPEELKTLFESCL